MIAPSEVLVEPDAHEREFDLETVFRTEYERVARLIAKVVRNRARAEELAVEVFLRLWRDRRVQEDTIQAWLYRVAVRAGLDELRRETRRKPV